MVKSQKDMKNLKAIGKWTKLKSTLLRPLRRGSKLKKKCWPLNKWRTNLDRWINRDWEALWNESCQLEKRRGIRKRHRACRRKKRQSSSSQKNEEETSVKTWIRVKQLLVNDENYSKAAREINEVGVAEPNE